MRLIVLFSLSYFLVLSANAQVVNIPDANFKNALLNHVPVINTNNDGEIQVSEATAFTGTMNVSSKNITNMIGVEAFTNMVTLNCQLNQITILPTNGLVSLQYLYASVNKLTSISITNLPALKSLLVGNNLLTLVTLSNLPSITELRCGQNKLPSLTLSNLPTLVNLACDENLLTSISLSNVSALKTLSCSVNFLTSLPFNALQNLNFLDCSYNQFTSLPLTGLNALTALTCSNNQISSLAFDNPGILQRLFCSNTNLTYLPAGLNALQVLVCKYADITSLILNNSNALNYLDFSGNAVTNFSLSNKPFLTDLICIGNQLATLTISNMPGLKYLRCDSNQLTNLSVTNFPALYDFICTENPLVTLTVNNLPSLWQLFVSNNKIASLTITNFPSLERLACDNNMLTSLIVNNLPKLDLFSCSKNLLTSLTLVNLPALEQLHCPDNKITSLSMVNFPALRYLTCYNNNISSLTLQNLPLLGNIQCQQNSFESLILNGLTSLYYLNCGQNDSLINLTLNNLPALQRLDCESTKLETMDLSQTGVNRLFCSQNQLLRYINLKNGTITQPGNNFTIFSNTALEFICADDNELLTLNNAVNTQLPGQNVIVSTLCNYSPANFNIIKGKVRFDETTNGCNALDSTMYNIKIKIDDGTQTGYTFTNQLGDYKFFVLQGSYIVSPVFENGYFSSTPPFHTIIFAGLGSTQVADLCISSNGRHPDLEITLLPLTTARPGFNAQYKLIYRNKGNRVSSGTATLNYDAVKLNFLSSIPNASGQTSGNLTWNYSALSPYETRTINLVFRVNAPPVVNIGNILAFTAVINPVSGDETPNDNTFTLNQVVIGAFDPNDKAVTEGSTIHISKIGDYLHYIVRFQNTGNAEAINVIVKDSLADNLDWNTLVPVAASHAYRAVISKSNKVEFIFEAINLPGKNTNEPASHGFVSFKIKPKPTVTIGEIIYNKADIYFDFNLPIITNTVSTTIINPKTFDNLIDLSVYSNPVKDEIRFTVKAGSKIKAINLYNTVGEKLYSETVSTSGTDRKINIANLPTGILFLQVITNGGTAVQKVIKLK